MSYEDYKKALKLGQREYQAYLSKGNYPYLKCWFLLALRKASSLPALSVSLVR